MDKLTIKNEKEQKVMREGGKKLAFVRNQLLESIAPGVSAWEIEQKAVVIIKQVGGKPSFMMVPGYKWATCVNVNDGVVHGIPKKEVIFAKDDIVSVDVGLYYEGFHTDTSGSVFLGRDKYKKRFLDAGRAAVANGIAAAMPGLHIVDISEAIETTFREAKLSPIKSLTGHGIGRKLHEDPYVPCYVARGARRGSAEIVPGMTLAIEVMYTSGQGEIVLDQDSWTLRTKDGKISALFEETVLVTPNGPFVLTA